jgi:putative ABC transport system permease protein
MSATASSPLGLALLLALRSLRHHRIVALATVLGVAIGMLVVCAILVVDNNTRSVAPIQAGSAGSAPGQDAERTAAVGSAARSANAPVISRVSFDRKGEQGKTRSPLVPTQKGGGASARKGVEDYAAMRLAVRLASLLSFLVGAVIVFYTMRFSVAARAREFCLLLCLGQSRAGVAGSLVAEALILGMLGTIIGLCVAVPAGQALLAFGISTTGQTPTGTMHVPWGELMAMSGISIVIALMGVAGPIREIYRMEIAQVLQPRFLSGDAAIGVPRAASFAWLLPPAIAAIYVLVRPFLISWLSVVQFFLFEAAFVTLLAAATLWWATPLLRWGIGFFEYALKPFLPLETLLTGRRMRLGSRQITFAVTGIVLVFGMLTALHDITRSLKDEIVAWANAAMVPYMFYERTSRPFDAAGFSRKLAEHGLVFVRMSEKSGGPLPIRLVQSTDVNPYRAAAGRPLLLPGTVIVSKTLAARHNLDAGDSMVLSDHNNEQHRFRVIEVADDLGFYAQDGRYVDLKSYMVFSEGNALFADNLQRSLGQFGTARFADGALPLWQRIPRDALYPYYLRTHFGLLRGYYQRKEIDRDFRIFDFILAMTVLLAAIGVANTLLIQVHGRGREFSVLRTIGMDRWQITKLLLAEGLIIGFVGALLAAIIGSALGAISVSFLDHFTLFDYRFRLSAAQTALFSALCIVTCSVAAIYPAFVAARTSSAESLHYE